MKVIAKSNFVHQTPRKLRLVANQIRGLKVEMAQTLLENLNKKAAQPLLLTLKQAVGNAVGNFHLKKESLMIEKLMIGKGPVNKRGRAAARGRWHPVLKRASHITLVLEGEEKKVIKRRQNGSKSYYF